MNRPGVRGRNSTGSLAHRRGRTRNLLSLQWNGAASVATRAVRVSAPERFLTSTLTWAVSPTRARHVRLVCSSSSPRSGASRGSRSTSASSARRSTDPSSLVCTRRSPTGSSRLGRWLKLNKKLVRTGGEAPCRGTQLHLAAPSITTQRDLRSCIRLGSIISRDPASTMGLFVNKRVRVRVRVRIKVWG